MGRTRRQAQCRPRNRLRQVLFAGKNLVSCFRGRLRTAGVLPRGAARPPDTGSGSRISGSTGGARQRSGPARNGDRPFAGRPPDQRRRHGNRSRSPASLGPLSSSVRLRSGAANGVPSHAARAGSASRPWSHAARWGIESKGNSGKDTLSQAVSIARSSDRAESMMGLTFTA